MISPSTPLLGLDIGGTKIAVCVGDAAGTILASDRIQGGTQQPYDVMIPQVIATAQRLLAQVGVRPEQVPVCGISSPGPIDIDRGMIGRSPNMVWANVPICRDVAAGLGIPTVLQNDANAGALAEWFFGVARGRRDVIYFTMSTGIGGGIIAAGRLIEGVDGNAGEVGHVILDLNGPVCGCGMRGCFEAFCGGRSVTRRLQALVAGQPENPLLHLPEVGGDPEKLGFEALRAGVRAGIPFAIEFWDDVCLRMAQGLGQYMMIFNPEMIIVGTVFMHSGEMLMAPVKRLLPRFVWPGMMESCRLELPALGFRIGELAGVCVALYSLHQTGEWQPPKG